MEIPVYSRRRASPRKILRAEYIPKLVSPDFPISIKWPGSPLLLSCLRAMLAILSRCKETLMTSDDEPSVFVPLHTYGIVHLLVTTVPYWCSENAMTSTLTFYATSYHSSPSTNLWRYCALQDSPYDPVLASRRKY